jgi:tRNA nucleotidyltransferase/poly(A) polymerase
MLCGIAPTDFDIVAGLGTKQLLKLFEGSATQTANAVGTVAVKVQAPSGREVRLEVTPLRSYSEDRVTPVNKWWVNLGRCAFLCGDVWPALCNCLQAIVQRPVTTVATPAFGAACTSLHQLRPRCGRQSARRGCRDVTRRDFTINSLLWDPQRNRVLDYNGGAAGVAHGHIESASLPIAALTADPIRCIRCAARCVLAGRVQRTLLAQSVWQ